MEKRERSIRASCFTLIVCLLVFSSNVFAAGHTADETAKYTVTFVPTWNPTTHPLEYPITHAKHGLLVPPIGATHGPEYALFAAGKKPTPGLERLSEMGKHDPLDAEIKQAIADGKAGSLIELTEGSEGPVHVPLSHSFDVQKQYPRVSIVGMIAPSPDWFYGVGNVGLLQEGKWVSAVTVEARVWDSGGDAGTTYMAEDVDLTPKQPTQLVDTPHFRHHGKEMPVGVFVFKRIPTAEK